MQIAPAGVPVPFEYSAYDLSTNLNVGMWTALYLEFQAFNQPNKLAYVAQLLSWGNSISTYTATYIATVMALTNTTTIVNTVFDPSQFAADPLINLLACFQISG